MEPSQIGFVEGALVLKRDGLFDELDVGHVGEWDLSSGDVIEHKIHGFRVYRMALSGDMIVTSTGRVIRVFNVSTCLLVLPSIIMYDEFLCS